MFVMKFINKPNQISENASEACSQVVYNFKRFEYQHYFESYFMYWIMKTISDVLPKRTALKVLKSVGSFLREDSNEGKGFTIKSYVNHTRFKQSEPEHILLLMYLIVEILADLE